MFGITAFSQSPFAALGGTVYSRDLTESVAASEAQVAVLLQPLSITETTAATATQTLLQTLAANISESTTPTDAQTEDMIIAGAVTESVIATETITQIAGKFVYVTESVAATDDIVVNPSIFNAALSASATAQDTVSTTGLILFEEQDETSIASDAVSSTQTLVAAIAESTTPEALQTNIATLVGFINESARALDFNVCALDAYSAITETTAATATQLGRNQVNVVLTESATAGTTQTSAINIVSSVLETAGASESITYTVDSKGIVTGVLLTISLTNVNVWGDIDDGANPNWVLIQD
jgi:hypothetical protein